MLTSATTPGQSEPERNSNERVLHIPQISKTWSSRSDVLMSYPGDSLVGEGRVLPTLQRCSQCILKCISTGLIGFRVNFLWNFHLYILSCHCWPRKWFVKLDLIVEGCTCPESAIYITCCLSSAFFSHHWLYSIEYTELFSTWQSNSINLNTN